MLGKNDGIFVYKERCRLAIKGQKLLLVRTIYFHHIKNQVTFIQIFKYMIKLVRCDCFRYTHLFNDLISPVMFVYLVVISVNLGVNIIQIVEVRI